MSGLRVRLLPTTTFETEFGMVFLDLPGLPHLTSDDLFLDRAEELREAVSALVHRANVHDELVEALEVFVSEYVEMVNSGDCGHWDPEEEDKVKAARAALASAKGEG